MSGPNIEIDIAIETVRLIIKQSFILKDALPKTNISPIIRQTIFYYYEGGEPGKWLVGRPHSASARAIRRSTRGRFPPLDHPMRYEHAIPLAVLQPGLRHATVSLDAMRAFLNRNVQGVVLTKHENGLLDQARLTSAMPARVDACDLLARYRAVGIEFEPDDEAALGREGPN